ncbi:hypothetical protein MRB53_017688 [Persea americana]|uniref:Uncharacterized protein n=1 Tax=Persea americana TaxID=3435 RepID=A0ACC2M6Q0_PERAE|nr:hypothetical protein MRB53_017688 [Persea americana]
MAGVFSFRTMVVSLVAVLAAFSFIGESIAADSPAPGPSSAAVAVSQALTTTVVVLVPLTGFLLGSIFKI